MADYKISHQAEDDLREIYRYGIERHGVRQADAFYDALYGCFDLIAASPMTWPKVDYIRPGYHRYIYRPGKGSTAIYYRIVEATVEIMTIVQRQNMPR